jgi:hypothetical protein
MEFKDLKVGQLVAHDSNFIGKIVEIKGSGEYADVKIEITDSNNRYHDVGGTYIAMPECISHIVKDVPSKFKVEAELEFVGLEKLEELIGQGAEALEILSDSTPFKVTIDGIVFEGTPVQFESFMATMAKYSGKLS